MGARLESMIDVPAPLLRARVPSMMLATLVENAIKHGIGPLAEGGTLRIRCRPAGRDAPPVRRRHRPGIRRRVGLRLGLANIRARLAAHYGDRRRCGWNPIHRGALSPPLHCHGAKENTRHEQRAAAVERRCRRRTGPRMVQRLRQNATSRSFWCTARWFPSPPRY